MTAEIFVMRIKYRQLQCIYYTSDCVYDSACQKPPKSASAEIADKGREGNYAGPPEQDVHNR